ncbi:hypothetical protein [Nodularia sp. UHCC 0506]|uniref:hypothetical protein n=1 Tax=Nodularia sp. UHCC 0506 TaxID=3110243 RepID=UPI002B1F8F13|nr:hypothetical protein [Nodularia sp. UHCC 0506]MEA5515765.1 hypothetical protein [Nodularia sp. UHCC 0506]
MKDDTIKISEVSDELRSQLEFAHKCYLKYGRGIMIMGHFFEEFSDMPIAPGGKHRYLYGVICLQMVAITNNGDCKYFLNYDPSKQFIECRSDIENYSISEVTVLTIAAE